MTQWHQAVAADLSAAHDANLPFHHFLKVLCWNEIYWLWRPLDYSRLTVMFKKPVSDDFTFVTCGIIVTLLEAAIRRWVHYNHKGMSRIK